MNIVVTFPNEAAAIVKAPKGTRFIYVGRDTAGGGAKIVTADANKLGRWMNDAARIAPFVESRDVVAA